MRDFSVLLFQNAPSPSSTPNAFMAMIVPFAIIFLVMYLIVIRPQKKQQATRQQMLSNLKKNDRVLTTGGIYGVVAAINTDDVTLKIDDQNNVRVRFARSAIASVLDKDSKDSKEVESVAAEANK
ncbi:MAG: preprotein translocase subunit YajC [Planctomycetota bacterium]